MKRFILSLLMACSLLVTPVFAEPEPQSETESFFYTQSEAERLEGEKQGMHPVIWVFVALGAGALGPTAVIINMSNNRDGK